MVANLKVPANLAVRLDPLTLDLYNPDAMTFIPYMQVTLPGYHLKGATTLSIMNQTASIENSDQFEGFLASAVYAENFTIAAKGSTTACLGKLKAHLTLDKKIELAGMKSLKVTNEVMANQTNIAHSA